MDFIKETSRGARFEPSYLVESSQLMRAFRAWRNDESPAFVLDEADALQKSVHKWDSYFRIEIGRWFNDAETVRKSKHESLEGLLDIFSDWRASTTTFEANVATEYRAAARGYLDSYLEYAIRVGAGDFDALLYSPVMSSVVESMMHFLPQDMPYEERMRECARFLVSEHFQNAPYQLLSARIFAVLQELVRHGAYANREKAKKRLSGFFADVAHVATYAPYCDAIVVDRPMAELASHPKVSLESRFGVKVFSLGSWQPLFDWLDELESSMSVEHAEALAAVFPE